MGERIRQVRRLLNMTLEEFGKKIGMKKSGLSQIENGINKPTEKTILFICQAFSVDETWLRTGKGKMFVELSEEQEIARFVGRTLKNQDETLQKRILSKLANFTAEQWKALELLLSENKE